MQGRRAATRAGKTLNDAADFLMRQADAGLITDERARRVEEAVRLTNGIVFQYYLIPREIREAYYREELAVHGLPVQDMEKE